MNVTIIDYGMGNLASVQKACRFLGHRAQVISDPKQVARAKKLILPGVGAFGEAMRELRRRRLIAPITDSIAEGKPFLGLCLGLQLLFESSEEAAGVRGLGILPGKVKRFPRKKGLKVPHMGWNQIHRFPSSPRKRGSRSSIRDFEDDLRVDSRWSLPSATTEGENDILRDIPDGAFMYFVHSFFAEPEQRSVVAARTEYGRVFPSVVWDGGSVWATQFHPEKSQKWGLRILENFLSIQERQC